MPKAKKEVKEITFTRHETRVLLAGGEVLVGGIIYALSPDREANPAPRAGKGERC